MQRRVSNAPLPSPTLLPMRFKLAHAPSATVAASLLRVRAVGRTGPGSSFSRARARGSHSRPPSSAPSPPSPKVGLCRKARLACLLCRSLQELRSLWVVSLCARMRALHIAASSNVAFPPPRTARLPLSPDSQPAYGVSSCGQRGAQRPPTPLTMAPRRTRYRPSRTNSRPPRLMTPTLRGPQTPPGPPTPPSL